jgi:23S rRNA pseudouridine2605 synthase
MWESQGFMVSRLKRVRYGNIELPRGLKRGNCEELAPEQIKALRDVSKAGAPEPTLTLQPVIHQRRATPTPVGEARTRAPQAWTGVHHAEARELTAFDRIRDDAPSRPGRGRKGGAPRTGGREVNGNVLRPDKPRSAGRTGKPRRAAPGQEVFIPRTWSAGDEFNRAGKGGRGGPGGSGGPGGRSDAGRGGPGQGPRGNRAGGDDNRGNRAPRDDNFGNRAPAGENRGRGGPRAGSGNVWAERAPGGAARPGGGRPGGGGRPAGNRTEGRPAGNRGEGRPSGGNRPDGRPSGGRPGGGGGGNRSRGPRGGGSGQGGNFNR